MSLCIIVSLCIAVCIVDNNVNQACPTHSLPTTLVLYCTPCFVLHSVDEEEDTPAVMLGRLIDTLFPTVQQQEQHHDDTAAASTDPHQATTPTPHRRPHTPHTPPQHDMPSAVQRFVMAHQSQWAGVGGSVWEWAEALLRHAAHDLHLITAQPDCRPTMLALGDALVESAPQSPAVLLWLAELHMDAAMDESAEGEGEPVAAYLVTPAKGMGGAGASSGGENGTSGNGAGGVRRSESPEPLSLGPHVVACEGLMARFLTAHVQGTQHMGEEDGVGEMHDTTEEGDEDGGQHDGQRSGHDASPALVGGHADLASQDAQHVQHSVGRVRKAHTAGLASPTDTAAKRAKRACTSPEVPHTHAGLLVRYHWLCSQLCANVEDTQGALVHLEQCAAALEAWGKGGVATGGSGGAGVVRLLLPHVRHGRCIDATTLAARLESMFFTCFWLVGGCAVSFCAKHLHLLVCILCKRGLQSNHTHHPHSPPPLPHTHHAPPQACA